MCVQQPSAQHRLTASSIPSHFVKLRLPCFENQPVAPKRKRSVAGNQQPASSCRVRLGDIERLRAEADRVAQCGRWADAIPIYARAISLSGPWAERTLMASIHFNQAVCLIKQNNFEEAIPHAEEATKHEPSFANAHFALGYALCLAGRDMAKAMRSFRIMTKLNPHIRIRLPNGGQLFGPKGRPTLAPWDVLTIITRPALSSAELPPNWVCRESRSQPGKVFYENVVARTTSWNHPLDHSHAQGRVPVVTPGTHTSALAAGPEQKRAKVFDFSW